MVIRRALVAILACVAPFTACAGGATPESERQGGPAAPIDGDTDGVLTGPVNQAGNAATNAEARQQELEQAGD